MSHISNKEKMSLVVLTTEGISVTQCSLLPYLGSMSLTLQPKDHKVLSIQQTLAEILLCSKLMLGVKCEG